VAIVVTHENPDDVVRPAVEPLLLSVSEAAQALGVGRTLTWELIRNRELKTVRVNRRVLVARTELNRFVAERMAS
jgi:excisionase family DNA binding protein